MALATVLSYVSGLAIVAPDLPPASIAGTTLVLHICDAVLCRLFARNNGYPRGVWTALGFVGGIWAVAVLIVLPSRQRIRPG